MSDPTKLVSMMYHYVRDPEKTSYKGIKGIGENEFYQQIKYLRANYEIIASDKLVGFLDGKILPEKKPFCTLSFDDGFIEHGNFVTDVLNHFGVSGHFFVTTGCIEDNKVLDVHKNHFLLASLDFDYYSKRCFEILADAFNLKNLQIDSDAVSRQYRWDNSEVGKLKYVINYMLAPEVRSSLLTILFEEEIGSEKDFAKTLYLSWEHIRSMNKAGMCIGGHTHNHPVLADLSDEDCEYEISHCMSLLRKHLGEQCHWGFAYPYGKPNAVPTSGHSHLQNAGVDYGFSSIVGKSGPDDDRFMIKRIDPKDI